MDAIVNNDEDFEVNSLVNFEPVKFPFVLIDRVKLCDIEEDSDSSFLN